jgi:hypothetical protein
MPTYVTIGYGDQAGYERTSPVLLEDAHRHDAALRSEGALIGIAGVPVQVRNHDGSGLRTTEGAFMHAELPLAGFAVIEASDLEHALELASRSPCAVAHGVVEVWPLEPSN